VRNELKTWRKNVDYFHREIDRIEREYGRKTYVVIRNQGVVDSGDDKFELSRKYHDNNVLIVSIDSLERIHKLRSPRIVKG